MKRHGILNPQLSRVIAELGHTDLLVIADAGLPLPPSIERIDLTLVAGVPGFLQTLEVILSELIIEDAWIAAEIREANPAVDAGTRALLGLEPQYVPHLEFKERTHAARAIVRTGECSAFSNLIVQCGVREDFLRRPGQL